MKENIKITLYKQNNFCTYIHTHCKNYKFPATNSTSFIYALYRVRNCSREIVAETFTTLTKSTRCATGMYKYWIFKPYFRNYNGRTI